MVKLLNNFYNLFHSSNFTNFSHRTAQQSYEITIKMAKPTYIHRDNNFCGYTMWPKSNNN